MMRYLIDTSIWIPYPMIAAIALAHDLTVITHNCDGFSGVPSLRAEDWAA